MKTIRKSFSIFLIMTTLLTFNSFDVYAENSSIQTHIAQYDSVVEYSDGGKDYTYIIDGVENHYFVPPTDFEPLEATDEQLARYCFPARPDVADQEAYAAWVELMANYSGTPEPEMLFTIKMDELEEVDETMVYTASATSITNSYSYNWSGYIADLGSSSTTYYTQVQADYEEPAISSSTASDDYVNSYWVGLGGHNSGKLVQAGTGTIGANTHYAWYEYLSDTGSTVSVQPVSLNVNAGDDMHVYISFQRSNDLFSYYIANNTTGKSASGTVTLDAAMQYDGTTAEWIVERSTVSGSLAYLGDYDTVTFTNCKATLNTSNTWYELGELSNLKKSIMRSKVTYGKVLSEPGSISANDSFTCTWKYHN